MPYSLTPETKLQRLTICFYHLNRLNSEPLFYQILTFDEKCVIYSNNIIDYLQVIRCCKYHKLQWQGKLHYGQKFWYSSTNWQVLGIPYPTFYNPTMLLVISHSKPFHSWLKETWLFLNGLQIFLIWFLLKINDMSSKGKLIPKTFDSGENVDRNITYLV